MIFFFFSFILNLDKSYNNMTIRWDRIKMKGEGLGGRSSILLNDHIIISGGDLKNGVPSSQIRFWSISEVTRFFPILIFLEMKMWRSNGGKEKINMKYSRYLHSSDLFFFNNIPILIIFGGKDKKGQSISKLEKYELNSSNLSYIREIEISPVKTFPLFSKLPYPVMLEIFRWLEPQDLCKLNATNRDMYAISSDETLWKEHIRVFYPDLLETLKKEYKRWEEKKLRPNKSNLLYKYFWKEKYSQLQARIFIPARQELPLQPWLPNDLRVVR